MYQQIFAIFLLVLAIPIQSLPLSPTSSLRRAIAPRSTNPLVFAHYMLITRPPNGDYTNDITLAKAAGIDAFALNYGGVDVNWTVQAGYLADFYQAAAANNFKVFLSVDCTSVTDPNMVVSLVNQYATHPAQFSFNGAIMLSSFQGADPDWNWQTDVLDHIPHPVFFLPGSCSDDASTLMNQSFGNGIFPWIHPTKTAAEEFDTDQAFATARSNSQGKYWMAAISPFFFKRFDADENWSNAQDDSIWVDRWVNLLGLKPDFIEIVTWNDWGESTYVGPADTTMSVPTAYWDTLNHNAFLKMATVFIKAYKAGDTVITVDPSEEDVFLFYRLQPAGVLGTTDTLPLPLDDNYLKNDVFVVPFLSGTGAQVTLISGGVTTQFSAVVGVSKVQVPWTLGVQTLTATRNDAKFVSKSGPSISGQLSRYTGNVVSL